MPPPSPTPKSSQLVAASWLGAFPRLCSYGQWVARLHTLSAPVGQLLRAALGLCGLSGRLYLIDGLPIRVCKSLRHGRVRLLREDGAHFGKTWQGLWSTLKLKMLHFKMLHFNLCQAGDLPA